MEREKERERQRENEKDRKRKIRRQHPEYNFSLRIVGRGVGDRTILRKYKLLTCLFSETRIPLRMTYGNVSFCNCDVVDPIIYRIYRYILQAR